MYPKKKYPATGGHVEVQNEAQEKALGPGWYDLPQAPPAPTAEQEASAAADAKAKTAKK